MKKKVNEKRQVADVLSGSQAVSVVGKMRHEPETESQVCLSSIWSWPCHPFEQHF